MTIEDLGNIELLFTDKTGTLTEGAITFDGALDAPGGRGASRSLLGLVCNEATLTPTGRSAATRSTRRCWRRPRGGRAGSRRPVGVRAAGPAAVRSRSAAGLGPRRGPPTADRCSSPRERRRPCWRRCVDVPAAGARRRCERPVRRRRPGRRRRDARRGRAGSPLPDDERDLHLGGFLTFTDRPKADAGAVDREARGARHRRQDHHRRQRHRRGQGLPRHRLRPSTAC